MAGLIIMVMNMLITIHQGLITNVVSARLVKVKKAIAATGNITINIIAMNVMINITTGTITTVTTETTSTTKL